MGNYICYPYSSMLSTMSFLRLFFLFKLFKHLTKWTSTKSEHVCEKYVCKADSKFAFKAFQKDNPFIMLVVTFVFSCLCFGLTIRTFERYYWENNYDTLSQIYTYDRQQLLEHYALYGKQFGLSARETAGKEEAE